MYYEEIPSEELFNAGAIVMSRRSRWTVAANMLRRPYFGTRLDRELKDAKDRARSDRH